MSQLFFIPMLKFRKITSFCFFMYLQAKEENETLMYLSEFAKGWFFVVLKI